MANNNIQCKSDQLVNTTSSTCHRMILEPIWFHMNASNDGNYNSFTQLSSPLKFKKLPFYDVIYEVIKPTALTMSEGTFKFLLSKEHWAVAGKNEYGYEFQIRIGLLENDATPLNDYLPVGLNIQIGAVSYLLPRFALITKPETKCRQTAISINCTEFLKLRFLQNMINIQWIPDQKKYVLTMCIVKKITVDTLIKRLEDKGGRRSSEKFKNDIKSKENNDIITSTSCELLCPFSKKRMTIPVTSIHCNHLQCFDARTFFLLNENKPTWKCPICKKSFLYDEIQIENYFLEILNSSAIMNSDCPRIEIMPDGEWKILSLDSTPDINLDEE